MVVDIIVFIVLLASALISFLRGLIREVLTIIGVVGGLAAAYFGGPYLAPYMRNILGVEEDGEPQRLFDIVPYTLLADILSYGSIFILVVIILSILSHALAESVRSIGLGSLDRTLGVVFGLVRGVLLLALLYLPFYLLLNDETKERWFEGSQTHFYLEVTAAEMAEFLPEETIQKLEEDAQKLEKTIQEKDRLEELKQNQEENTEEPVPAEDSETNGYTDDFRQKMDELFEQKTGNGSQDQSE